LIKEDPVNVLGNYRSWSQAIYRVYLASYGQMPRYSDFLPDVESIGRGVVASSPDMQPKMEANLNEFAADWVERAKFRVLYKSMTNERYLDTLNENAGITLAPAERAAVIDKLSSGAITRAQVLLTIVNSPDFIKKEENRSLVLLHYFGYLHRNPDDPPDKNLNGLYHWLKEVDRSGDVGILQQAFIGSIEYQTNKKR